MSRGAASWSEAERHAWRPSGFRSLSEWAEASIVLPATAPEPGPLSLSRTPYLREILDAFGSPWVEQVTLESARQMGKTTLLLSLIGYLIDEYPCVAEFYMGRDEDAETIADVRMREIVEASPRLARHLTSSRDLTKRQISLGGATVFFETANSAGAISSKPLEWVFADELHVWKLALAGEGNPVEIIRKGMENFALRKLGLTSTPTDENSLIHQQYLQGTRKRWHCRCPGCGHYQVLALGRILLPKGHEDERDAQAIRSGRLAEYECEGCGARIPEGRKFEMVAGGKWVAERKVERAIHESYWLGGIESPWRTFSGVLAEHFAAGTDAERRRAFKNTTLGDLWTERISEIPAGEASERVTEESYERGAMPAEAQMLTAFADWHGEQKGLFWNIWAFAKLGDDIHRWLIDYGNCFDRRELAERIWGREWRRDGTAYRVYTGIDSGWQTEEVYGFTRPLFPLVRPTRGETDSRVTAAFRETPIEYIGRGGKTYRGFTLLRIKTDYYKDALSRMLETPVADSTLHFPRGLEQVYLDHLTAEHKIRVNGRNVWMPKWEGIANHYLDALVGAWAIAEFWGLLRLQNGVVLRRAGSERRAVASPEATGAAPSTNRFVGPDGRPYLITERR